MKKINKKLSFKQGLKLVKKIEKKLSKKEDWQIEKILVINELKAIKKKAEFQDFGWGDFEDWLEDMIAELKK